MSKEKVKKDKHQCSVCGRLSAAASVLRKVQDEKTKEVKYFCTNQKKCAQDKKSGLVNGQRERKEKKEKKIIVEKKAAKTKTTEKVEAPATA